MLEPLACQSCLAPMQQDDGHVLCPSCLGVGHLREALTERACPDCAVMPWPVRVARLSALDGHFSGDSGDCESALLVDRPPGRKRESARGDDPPRKKSKSSGRGVLTSKVDSLSVELAQLRTLLHDLQAGTGQSVARPVSVPLSVCDEDDALSVAASDTHFRPGSDVLSSRVSESGSVGSVGSPSVSDEPVTAAIRMALAHLKLDVPQCDAGPSSAFFRRQSASSGFSVPPSAEYVKELHACWTDTRVFSRPNSDGRALASMQAPDKVGLGHMPAVEPAIASLIVHPEEALRTNARCPRPQCRATDDLLCKAYDMGARMGRIGNSLSHLLLGLSASLEAVTLDQSTQGMVDASLQAFAFMSRELGRLLSTLVQTRRQVWLAQSPLSEASRRVLRSVPVLPGELFGSAAIAALERTVQATQTRQQLVGLHRHPPRASASAAPVRGRVAPPRSFSVPRTVDGPSAHGARRGNFPPAQAPLRPSRRPPRPAKGRGALR
ncbi:unnamed protein product [Knipowitschia caucasica]